MSIQSRILSDLADEEIKKSGSRARVKGLFHKAWGQAHDSPDYDKKVWMDLQAKLKAKGIDV
jgi:hypothetical protein